MSLAISHNFGSLEKQLEQAKTNLRDLDDSIKRIYGKSENFRSVNTFFFTLKCSINQFPMQMTSSFRNDGSDRKRGSFDGTVRRNDGRFGGINRSGKIFNRLGSKEEEMDDFPRPKVASRVIKESVITREDKLSMQAKNSDLARNKRMFGSLLGTLQRFKTEEDKDVLEKRAKIEMKIEKQQLLDKEKVQKEKSALIADRRRQQISIRSIEMKMQKLKNLKVWEESKLSLKKFIGTKSKPQIFYLPKVMDSNTEKLLRESQEEVEKLITERRREVEEEIKQIEEKMENDLRALDEGKLKKSNDINSENSDDNDSQSDNENASSDRHVKDEPLANGKFDI